MAEIFHDRREAGRQLAARLSAYAGRPDTLVLALPRGGVPVAYEVARALKAPLDVFIVRKLGVPGFEELAMGAIATGGVRVLNEDVVEQLEIPANVIDAVAAKEREELRRRERLYRGGRLSPDLRGRTVILVDDGLATGATMQAAVKALRQQQPARIIVAVPTAAPETCESMKAVADDVICAITPAPFQGVGRWYEDFSQTTDREVRDLLAAAQSFQEEPMPDVTEDSPAQLLREALHELTGTARGYDPLMERIGDARFILLGEASHGTHEFYRERAQITKRLIREKGITAVAAEADWPDAWRLNRYVRGVGDDADAKAALSEFRRFPTWMWRNTEVVEFIEWLRGHNDALPQGATKVGFYGLDLYSLHASMKAVLEYLEMADPQAATRARERYACFDHFGPEPQVYGFIAGTDISRSCRDGVIEQLLELQRRRAEQARHDGTDPYELFNAEQNARVVKNAEAYYRSMFFAEEPSWNLRDRHMVETLEVLVAHLGRQGSRPKVALWAHNSHLGDARATEMRDRGELNVGQLVREEYGGEAVSIGFSTYQGTVTAASNWDAAAERKRVRPALPGSYEALFHAVWPYRFLLTWRPDDQVARALRDRRLERAIGVIYRPETERISHYFSARLSRQFDAILHFDATRAVEPLEYTAEWKTGEVPETYPFAV